MESAVNNLLQTIQTIKYEIQEIKTKTEIIKRWINFYENMIRNITVKRLRVMATNLKIKRVYKITKSELLEKIFEAIDNEANDEVYCYTDF